MMACVRGTQKFIRELQEVADQLIHLILGCVMASAGMSQQSLKTAIIPKLVITPPDDDTNNFDDHIDPEPLEENKQEAPSRFDISKLHELLKEFKSLKDANRRLYEEKQFFHEENRRLSSGLEAKLDLIKLFGEPNE